MLSVTYLQSIRGHVDVTALETGSLSHHGITRILGLCSAIASHSIIQSHRNDTDIYFSSNIHTLQLIEKGVVEVPMMQSVTLKPANLVKVPLKLSKSTGKVTSTAHAFQTRAGVAM